MFSLAIDLRLTPLLHLQTDENAEGHDQEIKRNNEPVLALTCSLRRRRIKASSGNSMQAALEVLDSVPVDISAEISSGLKRLRTGAFR